MNFLSANFMVILEQTM